MRITESKLRRLIRSVINETNKYEREVNNRKNREYRNLPFTMSQEQIQAKEAEEAEDRDIERCARQLVKLYKSYPPGHDETREALKLVRHVVVAGDKEQSKQKKEESRKFLLNASNMSSFSKYLESDTFWYSVQIRFKMDTGMM